MSLDISPLLSSTTQLDELVKKYIELESRPMASLETTRQELSQRSAMLRDLNASLLSLKTAAADLIPVDPAALYGAQTAVSSDTDVLTAHTTSGAINALHTVFIERLAGHDVVASARFASDGTDISQATGEGEKTFTITVGSEHWDVSVSVGAGQDNATVLANIASAIAGSDAADVVSASVVTESTGTSRLLISARSTGSVNAISLSEAGGDDNLLAASGATSEVLMSGESGGYLVARDQLDARFTLDGLAFVRSTNEVSDAIRGVTIKLQRAQAVGDAPVTVEVKGDESGVKAKVKAFVSAYNAVSNYLNAKVRVDTAANVRGDLAGDPTYLDLKVKLNRIVQGRVSGIAYPNPTRLADIGITLDESGNLRVSDETKLDDALTENPSGVQALLASADGVAARLRDLVEPFVADLTGIIARQQQSITSQMERVDTRVKDLEERLALREKALRTEFSSLLQAMQLMSAQSALLSSFMAQANSMLVY